jgi:hypothetical protein
LVLEAPKARRQLLGTSAEPGIVGQSLEARFQAVAVAAGLPNAELLYAVNQRFRQCPRRHGGKVDT